MITDEQLLSSSMVRTVLARMDRSGLHKTAGALALGVDEVTMTSALKSLGTKLAMASLRRSSVSSGLSSLEELSGGSSYLVGRHKRANAMLKALAPGAGIGALAGGIHGGMNAEEGEGLHDAALGALAGGGLGAAASLPAAALGGIGGAGLGGGLAALKNKISPAAAAHGLSAEDMQLLQNAMGAGFGGLGGAAGGLAVGAGAGGIAGSKLVNAGAGSDNGVAASKVAQAPGFLQSVGNSIKNRLSALPTAMGGFTGSMTGKQMGLTTQRPGVGSFLMHRGGQAMGAAAGSPAMQGMSRGLY